MKTIIVRFAALALVAGFVSGCGPEAVEAEATDELSVKAAPDGKGDACVMPAAADSKKCDGKSVHTNYYELQSRKQLPPRFKAKSRPEARAICAKWALTNLKPRKGDSGVECGKCPDGTDGCQVENLTSDVLDVIHRGNGEYDCAPNALYFLSYTCSVCTVPGCQGGVVQEFSK